MQLSTEKKLGEELSLRHILSLFAKDIDEIIKQVQNEKYCIGYHLRHVFDTNSSPIGLKSSDLPLARRIRKRTTQMGLHTLNHVLDSLYYPKPPEDLLLCMRVSYGMREDESDDHFREISAEGLRNWPKGERKKLASEIDELRKLAPNHVNPRYIAMGVRWDETILDSSRIFHTDLNVSENMFGGYGLSTPFFDQYLCGTQRLCSKLEIEPSLVSYRSIMAAIYQLGLYANHDAFGPETITFMLRPKDHFGFVIGLTLICENVLTINRLEPVIRKLALHYELLEKPLHALSDTQKVFDRKSVEQLKKVDEFKGLDFDSPTKIDKKISWHLAQKIVHVASKGSGPSTKAYEYQFKHLNEDNHVGALVTTIDSFLKIATMFCDEKSEGRQLRFGLVLAHPFLMRHWPGPYPLAVTVQDETSKVQKFFKVRDLAKQIHLLEGPEDRCVVIPYVEYKFTSEYELPAYTLELSDFEESLSSWSKGALWDHECRPYSYLTERYPWAVAAIIGPGSEIRVFVRGQLQAYRDGKGWKSYGNPIEKISTGSPHWVNDAGKKVLLDSLINVAMQLSPIARRSSHGGLIVYAPVRASDGKFWKKTEKTMQRMYDAEPVRIPHRSNWLTGLNILKQRKSVDGDDQSQIDSAVAELVLRAGSLDGAVVFCDPYGHVKYFGRRLTDEHPTSIRAKGTKRATAAAFVETLGRSRVHNGLAIAVSSDGPVRIYTYDANAGKVQETVIFEGY